MSKAKKHICKPARYQITLSFKSKKAALGFGAATAMLAIPEITTVEEYDLALSIVQKRLQQVQAWKYTDTEQPAGL